MLDRPPAERWFVRAAVALLLAVAAATVGASSAAAHAGLDTTSPGDGAIVDQPVDVITLTFTESVEPVADGFEVFLPSTEIVQMQPITDDGITFRLEFDPPLGNGDVGVRYEVVSADGHPVDGSFSFTIDAPEPVPTTAPPAPATAPAVTTASPPTGAATTGAPTTAPVPPSAPDAVTATSAVPATTSAVVADDASDGSSGALVAVLAALAAVALALGLWALRRRSGARRPS